ncbi:ATP-binding protein [Bradyrhizobium prioriisuperbiae]|uniref:AAA family ATPase n=1 Tax=Bradyrhizobium prioriisuperbiae TaxID=2854389 RepID=UPI0028F0F40A|nr:ATP-binding protein [Bradyrhizobium prioritasuperba]
MTNSKQIIAMIRSHAAGDSQQFFSIAEHIASDAHKSGKNKVAGEIRDIVTRAKDHAARNEAAAAIPLVTPRGELANLVRASYPETKLSDVVLADDLRRRIERLVREHQSAGALEERGLKPSRKFLFSGPPGTGKGMTAAALAKELNLPLFTIMLDSVITKYMGETAAKLRLIFDAMNATRAVYFFDEVDALAASRSMENDIGEARRMLNSFLQFLEDDQSRSVIIAATNHRSLLDAALFRRFHSAFVYAKPGIDEARRVIANNLLAFDISRMDWPKIDQVAPKLSQADLVAAAEDAAREAVLDNQGVLTTELMFRALQDRANIQPN